MISTNYEIQKNKPAIMFLLWKNLQQISGVTSWVKTLRPFLEAKGYTTKIAIERPALSNDQQKEIDLIINSPSDLKKALLKWSPIVLVTMNIEEHAAAGYALSRANHDGACAHMISVIHADTPKEYYEPLQYFDRHTHQFIAVSQRICAESENRLPWRKGQIAVMPCGVVCQSSVYRPQHANLLRLVYAGRVVQHQKRVLDFIPLVEDLESRNIKFRLTVAGDGPELKSLKNELRRFVHDGRVKFTGQVPYEEIADIWSENDVFINLSAFEGTSVSMLEAMAAGCVPLVTKVEGVNEVIEDGINGFCAPIGNIELIADIVERLDNDRKLLANLADQAHKTVLRSFSLDTYTERFSHLIEKITAEDPKQIPGQNNPKIKKFENRDIVLEGTENITVHTIYTDEHKELLQDYLIGTMRDDWKVYAHYAGQLGGTAGSNFGTGPYYKLLKKRVDLVIGSIQDHRGGTVLWIDTDVQFFGRLSKVVEDTLVGYDMAFQSEWSHLLNRPHKQVCCGIMAMRCNDRVLYFWQKVRDLLSNSGMDFPHGDQSAVNYLLSQKKDLPYWTVFDSRIWAMSHCNCPQMELIAHHANCTHPSNGKSSLELKLSQFNNVRFYLDRLLMDPFRIHFNPILELAKRCGGSCRSLTHSSLSSESKNGEANSNSCSS